MDVDAAIAALPRCVCGHPMTDYGYGEHDDSELRCIACGHRGALAADIRRAKEVERAWDAAERERAAREFRKPVSLRNALAKRADEDREQAIALFTAAGLPVPTWLANTRRIRGCERRERRGWM